MLLKLYRLTRKALVFFRRVSKLQIPVYAAHASFFIILSVFPLLVLFLGLLRYTGISVDTLTDALVGIIPEALLPSARKIILGAYLNTSGTVVSISAITALWSAGRGVYSLLAGLNAIYGTRENRGYFYTRSICMLYTFGLLLVLLLTLILYVFSTGLLQYLQIRGRLLSPLSRILNLRLILLLGVQILRFMAIYAVLPNRKNRLGDCFPGAVFSALGWMIFSHLYSRYVMYFPRYAHIYGSVYAVALSMLWLYFCISIVFYGGVLNRTLTELPQKKEKS